MQYILSEEEMKQGCQLIESWRVKVSTEQIDDKLSTLHSQGFFTVINDDIEENGLYEIIVYQKIN